MARVLKHKAKYAYIWTKNGRVFVKKDADQLSTVTHIKSFEQLKGLFRSLGIREQPVMPSVQ